VSRAVQRAWSDFGIARSPKDAALIGRDEVLRQVAAQGVAITRYDLYNWAYNGHLPAGIRADVGSGRIVLRYPPEIVPLIVRLRQLQAKHLTLEQIGRVLRAEGTTTAGHAH
jgi:hypothetical protein